MSIPAITARYKEAKDNSGLRTCLAKRLTINWVGYDDYVSFDGPTFVFKPFVGRRNTTKRADVCDTEGERNVYVLLLNRATSSHFGCAIYSPIFNLDLRRGEIYICYGEQSSEFLVHDCAASRRNYPVLKSICDLYRNKFEHATEARNPTTYIGRPLSQTYGATSRTEIKVNGQQETVIDFTAATDHDMEKIQRKQEQRHVGIQVENNNEDSCRDVAISVHLTTSEEKLNMNNELECIKVEMQKNMNRELECIKVEMNKVKSRMEAIESGRWNRSCCNIV